MSEVAVAAGAPNANERLATVEALDRLERSLREYADHIGEVAAHARKAHLELHASRREADLELHRTNRAADAKALELRATEVEGRLTNLNNEGARIAKVLEASVPREVFENYKNSQAAAADLARKELQTWKDSVNQQLTVSHTTNRNTIYIVGLIVSLIAIGARFISVG